MPSDFGRLRQELEDILRFLPAYGRNPIEGVRRAPNWSWAASTSLQVGFAIISGVTLGLLSLSFANFLLGLLVFPIVSVLQAAVISLFLYWYFRLVYSTHLERERLFGLVVLANIPYLLLHVISGFVPPIDLIGFGITCLLLIVGLNEHFHIDRRTLFRLIGGVYLVFFLVWAGTQFRNARHIDSFEELTVPKSLDTLEGEMK